MRATWMAVGLAALLSACGGSDKGADGSAGAPGGGEQKGPSQEAPQAGSGGAGQTHDVNMVLDGGAYKFEPTELTIKAGDVVRFHNKSGGPHNVSFWADSIPSGAAAPLQAGMPDQTTPLNGPLLAEPDAVYEVSFANAPAGEYKYYCLPHLALGMKAKLTVQ